MVKRKVKKLGRKLKRINKRYGVLKKIKKYGPGLVAAGLTAGGIAASVATGNPLPMMAAGAAGQGVSQLASDMHQADQTAALMDNRNTNSSNASAKPTGAHSGRRRSVARRR